MQARFTNVRWDDAGRLDFVAELDDLRQDIWVTLPSGVARPSDDLLGAFFATLAGPSLDSVDMELDLSPTMTDTIERFSGPLTAGLSAELTDAPTVRPGHAVSFSGGFDSLAAATLLPPGSELISMDFGGWFQRETDFFTRFDPHIVSTNFRMAGFGRRSWMFMLCGVILLRDHLNLGAVTTGSILESSPWHYRPMIDRMPRPPFLLESLGLKQVNTTMGITEVATTLLTMRHHPEHVADSLVSLAAPGTGKSLRKHMLVASLAREGKAAVPFSPSFAIPEEPPLTYGQSLTDDMLIPYMIQHSGAEAADALMSNVPDALREIADSRPLDFYERFHTGFYTDLPRPVSTSLFTGLVEAGIMPFTERDWRDYRDVIAVLRETHQLPN